VWTVVAPVPFLYDNRGSMRVMRLGANGIGIAFFLKPADQHKTLIVYNTQTDTYGVLDHARYRIPLNARCFDMTMTDDGT
jgi:hypothetical protein